MASALAISKYAEAEPLNQQALKIWEQVLGPQHSDVAASLNNLAELYDAQGKYAEAEPLYAKP
jgi:tetratricopeptide (TPR) repeat protein